MKLPLHTPVAEPASGSRRHTILAVAIIVLTASAIAAPVFALGVSGHDTEVHLQSWLDISGQWREGVIYPRWAAGANYGYGEPRFIFYPPLSWMLGAALGRVLPWPMVPAAFDWLALVIAGMAMFSLARDWLSAVEATGAAALYAANPYMLVIVFYRNDFAELLGVALYPLLLRGALRLKKDGVRAVPAVSLALGAIWLSNAPAAVIATYALVLLLAIEALQERAINALLAGSAAIAGGFGLAAFYIVPAAYEQRWVRISQATAGAYDFTKNFLFSRGNDPDFNEFNRRMSVVSVGMILATVLAAWLLFQKRTKKRDADTAIALLASASSLLLFSFSWPLWGLLPKMRFLQFPWRWLGMLGAASVFLIAAALGRFSLKWLVWGIALLAVAGSSLLVIQRVDWDGDFAASVVSKIQQEQGYAGLDEYGLPVGDHNDLPPQAARVAVAASEIPPEQSSSDAQIEIQAWGPQQKAVFVQAARPVTVAVRLLNYPAWEVWVNGQRTFPQSAQETGQMEISLASGANRVRVIFARTRDRWFGGAISILSGLALLIAWPSLRGLPLETARS